MADQLIPRQAKRKRQPTAECMRQQLVLAADEIIRLREAYHAIWMRKYSPDDRPWWRRLLDRST